MILSCTSQAPIPCSPPPGDHVQTVLRACVTWDFPALLAKPWCLLTFSLVSPLLILLPPVCSLLFSHHEMLFPKDHVLSYSPCTFILFLDGLLAYIISSTQRPLMCEESKPSTRDSRTTSDYLLDICTTVTQVLHMTCSSENLSFSACIPKPTPLLEFLTSFDDIVIQPGLQA